MRVRPAATLGLVLAGLVVVAAALAGPLEFTGFRWDLQAGTTDAATAPGAVDTSTPEPVPTQAGAEGFPAWLGELVRWVGLALLALLAAALVVWLVRRWLRARRSPRIGLGDLGRLTAPADPERPSAEPEPEPEPETVQRGLERALHELAADREPTDAIVAAWLGLQDTAQESGLVRGAAETATEFTTRLLTRVHADGQAARALLALYLRVRFGDHPATAQDVAGARAALESLAASWQDTGEWVRR